MKTDSKNKKVFLHIRIPKQIKKAFMKAAEKNGVNLSAWVLLTLNNALSNSDN